MLSEELLPHGPSLFSEQLSTANLSVDACSGSSMASNTTYQLEGSE